jgi:hypothetical protein
VLHCGGSVDGLPGRLDERSGSVVEGVEVGDRLDQRAGGARTRLRRPGVVPGCSRARSFRSASRASFLPVATVMKGPRRCAQLLRLLP